MLFHLRPLVILALIWRLSYHLGQISGGKDDTEAESMLPQSGVSCSRPDLRLRQPVSSEGNTRNTLFTKYGSKKKQNTKSGLRSRSASVARELLVRQSLNLLKTFYVASVTVAIECILA